MDSATEEVEVEGEAHQEVVALLEEVPVEVQEEEASSARKEAQKRLSYVCRLSSIRQELRACTGTTQASGSLRCSWKRRHAGNKEPHARGVSLRRKENLSGI